MKKSSLNENFEHDVKQSILRTYVAVLQYKFQVMQKETNKEIQDELEAEMYKLINAIEVMIKKDK